MRQDKDAVEKRQHFFYCFGVLMGTVAKVKQMARNEASWEELQAAWAESKTAHANFKICFLELTKLQQPDQSVIDKVKKAHDLRRVVDELHMRSFAKEQAMKLEAEITEKEIKISKTAVIEAKVEQCTSRLSQGINAKNVKPLLDLKSQAIEQMTSNEESESHALKENDIESTDEENKEAIDTDVAPTFAPTVSISCSQIPQWKSQSRLPTDTEVTEKDAADDSVPNDHPTIDDSAESFSSHRGKEVSKEVSSDAVSKPVSSSSKAHAKKATTEEAKAKVVRTKETAKQKVVTQESGNNEEIEPSYKEEIESSYEDEGSEDEPRYKEDLPEEKATTEEPMQDMVKSKEKKKSKESNAQGHFKVAPARGKKHAEFRPQGNARKCTPCTKQDMKMKIRTIENLSDSGGSDNMKMREMVKSELKRTNSKANDNEDGTTARSTDDHGGRGNDVKDNDCHANDKTGLNIRSYVCIHVN